MTPFVFILVFAACAIIASLVFVFTYSAILNVISQHKTREANKFIKAINEFLDGFKEGIKKGTNICTSNEKWNALKNDILKAVMQANAKQKKENTTKEEKVEKSNKVDPEIKSFVHDIFKDAMKTDENNNVCNTDVIEKENKDDEKGE